MQVLLTFAVLSLALLGSKGGWGAVEAQSTSSLSKADELTLLRTWTQDADYASRLPLLLYQCAHPSSVDVSLTAAECNAAHFLHFHAGLTPSPSTAASRTLKVDNIPTDSPYPTIFEDYIAKQR